MKLASFGKEGLFLRLYGRNFEMKESKRHEIELPLVSV